MANYGFVIDNKKCIGCHACSTACKAENEVPLGVNRTWVKYVETGKYPEVSRSFQVTRCNHCENPPCVAICPVSAMYQRKDGIVEFESDACIGCKACIQACPYDAIYIDPATSTAAKCHYCAHRTEVGLEPACVVVCPEHAILAGDMDDPESEIAKVVAKEKLSVRKPEQGTKPKLYYIEGNKAALDPLVTDNDPGKFMWSDTASDNQHNDVLLKGARKAEQMVQVGHNAQHPVHWKWQVPAYIVTKDIAAGLMMIVAAFSFLTGAMVLGVQGFVLGASMVAMTVATTVLLVLDLKRPERFLNVLLRPQWRSWLARGGVILTVFGGIVGLYTVITPFSVGVGFYQGLLVAGAIFGFGAAVYTAYLLGQAEGRDLWQSPLVPVQFFVRAVLAGAAWIVVLGVVIPFSAELMEFSTITLIVALAIDLGMSLFGEFGMSHQTVTAAKAAKMITRGKYASHFWLGFLLAGRIVPLLVLMGGNTSSLTAAAVAVFALVGLYLMEHAFIMAPQHVANS